MSPYPSCGDCRHFYVATGRCAHPHTRPYGGPKRPLARKLRGTNGPCGLSAHLFESKKPTIDPRDPDPSRPGIFRNHNCWKCSDGAKPCVAGNPNQCEYPHARND